PGAWTLQGLAHRPRRERARARDLRADRLSPRGRPARRVPARRAARRCPAHGPPRRRSRPMTACAILQPSYIPWRGYFHQIQKSDVFVFYDDVQYDKHGWRNRNRVKTANGPVWLSVPVRHKGNVTHGIPIKDIEIAWDHAWNAKHWATLTQSYARAPHF